MIVAVFRRRLQEGKTFEDFKQAWEADKGFVAIEPDALEAGTEQVAAQEQVRHNRIDDVIESTELRAMYRLATEHDLAHDPREIEAGSPESLLGALLS